MIKIPQRLHLGVLGANAAARQERRSFHQSAEKRSPKKQLLNDGQPKSKKTNKGGRDLGGKRVVPYANPYTQVSAERNQDATTRQHLYAKIEKHLNGRRLILLFTSFVHPASLDDADADMLQSILQHEDISKGLVVMLSSPGGDGLAAERMVRVCRSYSGTKDFWALVPGKAKSAATLVCMGASKILMAPASELGPIEPVREVWIHDEAFAASRLSMMRIMARRTKAATVIA